MKKVWLTKTRVAAALAVVRATKGMDFTVAIVFLGLLPSVFAASVTFDAPTLASGNGGVGSNDLGTVSVTVSGSDGTAITVSSTGTSASNLFSGVLAPGGSSTGKNVATLGVAGGDSDSAVQGGAGESMTVSFNSIVSLSQLTFTSLGIGDDNLIVQGIPSSPGVITFSTLGTAAVTNLNYSYDAMNDTLTVDCTTLALSTGGTFAYAIAMTFQNPVILNTFSFSADQIGNGNGGAGLNAMLYESANSAAILVNIDTEHPQWQISTNLVGLHQVYCNVPDFVYTNGDIAAWAKRTGISTSRFPGGTVVKYWDWENPTGVKTGDSWDPAWDTNNNVYASEWMSLDEYIAFVEQSGIRPIFGVNALSGQTYNREADGIARAVRMVKYVKDRGHGGALWYIGNEEEGQYPGGISGYAQVFARYAQAMKAKDPNILIFWNNNNATPDSVQTFLNNDGGTADGLETHGKWPYGSTPDGYEPGTYDEWLVEVPLRDRKNSNRAWREAANTYRAAAAAVGHPNLLIANNEYGIGNDSQFVGFTRYTTGLVITEMLMEHFIGNWFSACYYDMDNGTDGKKGLLDHINGYHFNPSNFGLNMLADAQGGDYLATVDTAIPSVHGFAASKDGVLLLYLLNKTTNSQPVMIQLSGTNYPTVFARYLKQTTDTYGKIAHLSVSGQDSQFTAELPKLTFTEFAFADPSTFLKIQSLELTSNGVANLRWTSIPGATFDLEQSADLSNWQAVQSGIAPDNLWTESEIDTGTNAAAFWRTKLKP